VFDHRHAQSTPGKRECLTEDIVKSSADKTTSAQLPSALKTGILSPMKLPTADEETDLGQTLGV